MCKYVSAIETKTKFVLLMHPKEFQKTKNGTGHFTNLNLKNSELFIGIDFNNHKKINDLLNDPSKNCYVLYPGIDSIKLNNESIKDENKSNVIFIIDSTWPCSKKILRVSKNISALPKISFEHNKSSIFKIKTQPNIACLSTIESTKTILEFLNKQDIEKIPQECLDNFLKPFEKMIEYQVNKVIQTRGEFVRYKKY